MSYPAVPPPTYSQDSELGQAQGSTSPNNSPVFPSEAQLLISPSGSSSQFQKGYLGASGERAAIEGEIQIKGIPVDSWKTLTVSLCTTEASAERQIELNAVDVELYSRARPSGSSLSNTFTVASSIPFSIPLTSDTPQCLHVGHSSLSHVLTATLLTEDPSLPLLTRSIAIHTRRFTSHTETCDILPYTMSLSNPTTVEVQVPRTIYRLDEPIPVYVTVPPPHRSVVLDHGFTLRSVRAELIRTVKLLTVSDSDQSSDEQGPPPSDDEDESDAASSDTASSIGIPPSAEFLAAAAAEKGSSSTTVSSSDVPEGASCSESPFDAVIARSGSSCRFHTSRPVKLRLVLHGKSHSPRATTSELPDAEIACTEDETLCASISQTTLLHSVDFRIQVRVTFLHVSTRTEQTYPLIIPITVLPPPAPLPEIDPALDSDYRKKHDRPPVKTVRREDSDVYTDDHDVNHAGPSALPNGAPPPFDDAPPPFFSVGEASTSSRLPTFYESETEIFVPSEDHPAAASSLPLAPVQSSFDGEGVHFGFPPSEQYDGYSGEMIRSSTPPPSLEMAREDTDVTDLAGLVNQPERAIDALNMVLEQREAGQSSGEFLPPPPPPMDDPSDPPPSIDSDFRSRNPNPDPPPSILSTDFTSPGMVRVISNLPQSSPPGTSTTSQTNESIPPLDMSRGPAGHDEGPAISPSHAPPPYLNPTSLGDTEQAPGPPPYVDLLPPASNQPH